MILPNLRRDEEQRLVGIVTGETGSGKTTLVKAIAGHYKRVIFFERFPEKSEYGGEPCRTSVELYDRLAAKPPTFRLSYYPSDDARELPRLCRLAWAVGDVLLVFEEADSYFPSGVVPDEFRWLATRGRHHRVSILAVSPAPYYLPKVLRREAQFVAAFSLSEESDRDWVAEYPGAGKEGARLISGLRKHDYILVERGKQPMLCRASAA